MVLRIFGALQPKSQQSSPFHQITALRLWIFMRFPYVFRPATLRTLGPGPDHHHKDFLDSITGHNQTPPYSRTVREARPNRTRQCFSISPYTIHLVVLPSIPLNQTTSAPLWTITRTIRHRIMSRSGNCSHLGHPSAHWNEHMYEETCNMAHQDTCMMLRSIFSKLHFHE
ncbi:ABC transporter, multidrug resistance associated protein [Dorcoceras hygrometricum]|uniref:ABC transporter, multidrug resistance associated protein n=1 Tax=Dorcoceras hygrometricum TaxID=472368 RepID=A0A2Z7C0Q3_9LAMI|nr:ABC transporter, multidrug resistance associated protein [Dorcoceras hygrometricum]